MTTSLIDSLNDVNTPDLAARLATSLGEEPAKVASGLSGGMAAMLMGMLSRKDDALAMDDTFSLVSENTDDAGLLGDPTKLVGSPADAPAATVGRQFLATIFGPRAAAVNEVLVQHTGLRFGSVASLMQVAAPLVLAVLGKRARDAGLTPATFARLLNDESSSIQQAAPAGLSKAVGMEQREPEVERSAEVSDRSAEVDRDVLAASARSYRPAAESGRGRHWLWPMAIAAGIAMVWALSRRHHAPEVAVRDTGGISSAAGDVVARDTSRISAVVGGIVVRDTSPISPTAGSVAGMVARPGMKMLQLRNGKTIEVPEASSEAKIVGFLMDDSRATDDTSWFALDELHFPAHSTTLQPEGKAQIQRLAEIMKAYPTAVVTIAGFTDNVGNEARNERLSRARADHARDLMVHEGVDAKRITANGYGSALPRADNTTEAGRAENRRIALLFVKK